MTINFKTDGPIFTLRAQVTLNKRRDELFPFFANAANLETLTPASLHFKILTSMPVEMKPGALINYRLKILGVPVRWQSRITAWEPPHRFVDEQVKGPYRLWIHEHSFEEDGDATVARDFLRYQVPGRAFMHELFVKEQLRRIFAFRQRKLVELFGSPGAPPLELRAALDQPLLPGGITLAQASQANPLLIIFLRHSGCTFCRETLTRLSAERKSVEAKGIKTVLVHMGSDESAVTFFSPYGLSDLARISDPGRKLYRAFGLARGTAQQVLGFRSLIKGLYSGALFRHGIGIPVGDAFQMPGSFLLSHGQIVASHVPESAADEAAIDSCLIAP